MDKPSLLARAWPAIFLAFIILVGGDRTPERFAIVALGIVIFGYFVPTAIIAYQSHRKTHPPPSDSAQS